MTKSLNARQFAAAKVIMNRLPGVRGNSNSPFTGSQTSIWQGGIFSSADNAKHNLYYDFGYPQLGTLEFYAFYYTWRRNGMASGLVEKTAAKTWEDHPTLLEQAAAHEETQREKEIRQHFQQIRFWQALQETDARSMVGKYAGVILQLGDGQRYDQPVNKVPGGIEGLISVLPAWQGQLEPSDWDTDPSSPTYGQPSMFRFNESSVDPEHGKVRSFSVHPDRAYIWSKDRTTWGESKLEPIYNALMDMEKLRGAGAEGFWKNAKSQPVLQADAEVDFNGLATMLGTDLEGLADALDEVVSKWTKGFDESLILQGMEAKTLEVKMPTNPEKFFENCLVEVAAAWPIPQKTLVGMQTGERASTEDAREWAQTNMSRRKNMVIPNIMDLVNKFERWGMLPNRDWHLDWADLTAPTLGEKLDIGKKMAEVNQAMFATGEAVFTDDEIRDVVGYESLDDGETGNLSEFDDDDDEDEDDGETES